MIRANLDIDTKTLELNEHEVYCAYCGRKIEPDTEIDEGERTEYYHCSCDTAKKEIELIKEMRKIDDERRRLQIREMDVRDELGTLKANYEIKLSITKKND